MLIFVNFKSGLDNKITIYPLSLDEDVQSKKRHIGTHTSYMSCCIFPGTDQQVRLKVFKFGNFLY